MNILVSACLMGENCKYNGGNNYCEKVVSFLRGQTPIQVCPEVLGKLPVPRPPAEIVEGIVTNTEGENVDSEFREGAQRALEIALSNKVELAILKANSPSCGCGKIYDGSFSKTLIKGDGVFVSLLKKYNVPIYTENEVDSIKQ